MAQSIWHGTIHKQRQQFLRIFDTPSLMPAGFSAICRQFDQFLTPTPFQFNCDVVHRQSLVWIFVGQSTFPPLRSSILTCVDYAF